MTTFLLTISLLLNGVAIYFIIILYTRQNRLIEVEKGQDKLIRDVEEIITSSLLEMKEENELFIKKFQQVSIESAKIRPLESTSKKEVLPSREKVVENVPTTIETKNIAGAILKKQAVNAYKNISFTEDERNTHLNDDEILSELKYENINETAVPEKPSQKDINENSQSQHENIYRDLFINQVMILKKQGFSIDEIAKKLSKGKTEIELLLKFGQNEG